MSTLEPPTTPAPGPPLPGDVATRPGGPADPSGTPAPSSGRPARAVRSTRTGRVWVGVCAAALIAVALLVFMVQNTQTVQVTFLGLSGSTSLALMLLIAAVGGILLTLLLGSVRILQLRRAVRRRRD